MGRLGDSHQRRSVTRMPDSHDHRRWRLRFVRVWCRTCQLKAARRTENWSDEDYYRRAFSIPDSDARSADKFATTRAAITAEIIKDKYSARILDLGSGFGYQANHIGDVGYRHVYACDLVHYRVARGRALHGRNAVRYLAGNMQMLCFPDASFDAITISVALHDLASDAIDRTFGECRRVLKPAGKLVLMEPRYLKDIPSPIHRWAYRLCGNLADESLHMDGYMNLDIRRKLREYGFELVRQQLAWRSILCIYTFETHGAAA